MSKVAAAITSPATKAAKQENSTKSLRSIRIRAPSPLLRGLRLASKRLIMAKDRARGHRIEAPWLALPLRPLERLAEVQEPGSASGKARGGGGLGKMTRRKREIIGLRNERGFPHVVELALPPEGFRSVLLEIDAFHRDRRIPVRRGRNRHEGKQVYIRFCFPHTATADAFRNRFGGECLTARSRLEQRRR
jgi:hypothetical protein